MVGSCTHARPLIEERHRHRKSYDINSPLVVWRQDFRLRWHCLWFSVPYILRSVLPKSFWILLLASSSRPFTCSLVSAVALPRLPRNLSSVSSILPFVSISRPLLLIVIQFSRLALGYTLRTGTNSSMPSISM